MQSFNPIEDVFKGRHFDRQIIILCVSWYTSFKLSLRDLVIMMAERGIHVTHTTILGGLSATFQNSKSGGGATLGPSAVRGGWTRLYKGSRTMGIPVWGRRQSRPDGGFLSQPEPGRKRRQIVSPQRDEEHSCAHENHVERLCGFASCGAGDERKRRTSGRRPGSIQPVLEQSGGTGPSESEATDPADAGIQAIR